MENKNVFVMKQPALGKRISDLRKQKGYTQEELVERCNISVRTIQRIESGEVTPRSFTIKTILQALEVEMNEIFAEEGYASIWTKEEKKTLNISWIAGIFLVLATIVAYSLEYFLIYKEINLPTNVITRFVYSVLVLVSLYFFLSGYRVLGIKHQHSILQSAAKAYMVITAVTSVIMIGSSFFEKNDLVLTISSVFVIILIGFSELILGIGILRLKENYGAYAQVVGILKIIAGAMMITVLLSVFGIFLMIPILILEVILLFKINEKGELKS